MCKAFAFLMTRNATCYWKAGTDSHDALLSLFKGEDAQLRDISSVQAGPYCQGEYVPDDYLQDGGWHFDWESETKPSWWGYDHERAAGKAFCSWHSEVYDKINLAEARDPIHPFQVTPPEITDEILALVRDWASVRGSVGAGVWKSVGESVGASMRASVWASVWASVGASVWASVRASVWESVWASVGASVGEIVRASGWASVWASVWKSVGESVSSYIGSLFDIWPEGYPFQAGADLWRMGLVPSFDGVTWRLHGGPDGAVLWEGVLEASWAI